MCKYMMLINMGGKKLTFESLQSAKRYAKYFIYIISQLPTAKFLSRYFTNRELMFIKAQQFARGQPQVRKQNLTQLCRKRNSFKQSCQSVSFSSKNLMAYWIEQQAQVQKKVLEFLPVHFRKHKGLSFVLQRILSLPCRTMKKLVMSKETAWSRSTHNRQQKHSRFAVITTFQGESLCSKFIM